MPSAELAVGIANLPNQRCVLPSLHLHRHRCLRGNVTNLLLGIKLSPNGGQPLLLCLQVTRLLENPFTNMCAGESGLGIVSQTVKRFSRC